jgi:phosphate-selective porin OprO/OprP
MPAKFDRAAKLDMWGRRLAAETGCGRRKRPLRKHRMKQFQLAVAVLLILAAASRNALAQDPDTELAELRRRIEALELQNETLLESLNGASFERFDSALSRNETADLQASGPIVAPSDDPSPTLSSLCEEECPPSSDDVAHDLQMTASWHHGLELATKDKDFRIHIGGRTQFDTGWYSADENVQENINNPYEDGVDFRRGRLRIDGTMYSTIDWAVEYDFFNSIEDDGHFHTVTGPTDLWLTFREVPCVGNVRIGNQKPAIGFEHLVSSRFLPFMERSYNQDAFYGGSFNGFWPGVSCYDNWGAGDMGTWNWGLFKPTSTVFAANANDGDYATVLRLTRLAWYECDGASLLHFGGSAMAHSTVEDRITFRTRDAIRSGLSVDWPVPASTGSLAGDDLQWLNGEMVAVSGPWTLQSEYLISFMQDAAPVIGNVVQPIVGDVFYHGGYVQILCFLTGEHDNYNKATGVFDRVIPHDNFYFRRGCGPAGPGAWQIGARYNFLDLNDNGIDGGILHNLTCGLNWFLNPNMKLQFDYFATDRDAPLAGDLGDGWIHGWGIRLAHDF